jgi:hypothetical protein
MFGYSDVQISIERGQKYKDICNLEEFLQKYQLAGTKA